MDSRIAWSNIAHLRVLSFGSPVEEGSNEIKD